MTKSKVKKVLAGIGIAAFVGGVSFTTSGCVCCKHKKTSSCGSKMKQEQKSSCSAGDVKKDSAGDVTKDSAGDVKKDEHPKSDDTKAPAKE